MMSALTVAVVCVVASRYRFHVPGEKGAEGELGARTENDPGPIGGETFILFVTDP